MKSLVWAVVLAVLVVWTGVTLKKSMAAVSSPQSSPMMTAIGGSPVPPNGSAQIGIGGSPVPPNGLSQVSIGGSPVPPNDAH